MGTGGGMWDRRGVWEHSRKDGDIKGNMGT